MHSAYLPTIGNPPTETATACRQSQIEEQLDSLRAVISDNHNLTSELNQRLVRVLRDDPETDQTKENAPDKSLVPIADAIRSLSRNLAASNNQLRSILGRVEA